MLDVRYLYFNVCEMYVIYVSMHDVHVIFDALTSFYDDYDVCKTMLLT